MLCFTKENNMQGQLFGKIIDFGVVLWAQLYGRSTRATNRALLSGEGGGGDI